MLRRVPLSPLSSFPQIIELTYWREILRLGPRARSLTLTLRDGAYQKIAEELSRT